MLDQLGHFLLVLDNADNLDKFIGAAPGTKSLIPFLPGKGDILITTRDPRFLGELVPADQGKRVKTLESGEAHKLLFQSIPTHLIHSTQQHDIEDLLDQLGDLPLAICQAAANIRELQIDLPRYLGAYTDQKNRMEVMQVPFLDHATDDERNHLQSINITWRLSFTYLRENHPLSAVALQIMSLLNWSGFPTKLLSRMEAFRHLTPLSFQAMLSKLLHLSLIDEDCEIETFPEYSLHPVVHEMIFYWLTTELADEVENLWSMVVDVIWEYFPFVFGKEKANVLGTMRYLLPHVLRLIQISVQCGLDLPSSADLTLHAASFMSVLLHTRAAAQLSVQAVDHALRIWSPDDANVYWFRRHAARCLVSDARYTDAEAMSLGCLHMLEYQQVIFQLEKEELLKEKAWMLATHAQSLYGQDRVDELDAICRSTIQAAELAGWDKAEMYPLHHNMANNLCRQGRFAEARVINDKLVEDLGANADQISAADASLVGLVLNVRIKIWENLAVHCDNPSQVVTLKRKIAELYVKVYILARDRGGVYDLDFWKAANNLLGHYARANAWKLAVDIAIEVLDMALDSDVILQGQFLETFSIFAQHIYFELHPRVRFPSPRIRKLIDSLNTFLDDQNLSSEDLSINAAFWLNTNAVRLQWCGEFSKAEDLHRTVLESEDLSTANLAGFPHYNLMLAIAQQPGRLAEAYRYRAEHLSLMVQEEEEHGTLDQRVQRWKAEREIYDEAKEKIKKEDLSWTAQWCQDHKSQLEKAQRRWGWLFAESDPDAGLHEAGESTEGDDGSLWSRHFHRARADAERYMFTAE